MRDIPNGIELGYEYNWDHDLCIKIVDQEYRVKIEYERELEGLDNDLRERAQKLESLGLKINADVKLSAIKTYTSPLEGFNFVSQLENSGFELEIEERKFTATGQSYWEEISKEDLEKILKRERPPACRREVQYNPSFNADVGE